MVFYLSYKDIGWMPQKCVNKESVDMNKTVYANYKSLRLASSNNIQYRQAEFFVLYKKTKRVVLESVY